MITKFVRPGAILDLPCRAYCYFGSGSGHVRMTTNGACAPSKMIRDNGFVQWVYKRVALADGQQATVEEYYYPGGSRSAHYIADRAKWREQRRNELTRYFADRRSRREHSERVAAREAELLRLTRNAYGAHAQMCVYSSWVVEIACGVNLGHRYSWHTIRWELRWPGAQLHRVQPPPGLERVHDRLVRHLR